MISVNRELIIERLVELADEQRQKELWLASGGAQVSSFVEAVCGLFDDSALSDALDSSGTEYGSVVDSRFLELGRLLDAIDYRRTPADLIDDPRMRDVRRVANEIVSMIGSPSPDEGATGGT